MQALRNAPILARLVLAWFALFIGVAAASPVFKPVDVEFVCSAGGAMKMVVKTGAGDTGQAHHTLDCPLCLSVNAPPPVAAVALPATAPLGHAVQPIPAARIAALTAAPLPARGPPSTVDS
jgi:hypothetical protein